MSTTAKSDSMTISGTVEGWEWPSWTRTRGGRCGRLPVRRHHDAPGCNGDKAFAAGFEMRPLEQTARETLEWFNAQDAERQELRSGLMPEREAELLAAFRG